MLILVSGATKTLRRFEPHPRLGRLKTPIGGNSIETIVASGSPWAADNAAYSGWNQEKFWTMLRSISLADVSRLLWVACPDVVGDAQATINLWTEWHPQINALGLPAAFVGQDGLESIPDQIPWEDMACFFIGGSTEWKLSLAAERFICEARDRGIWTHIGRVNTQRRVRHAIEIGADSIDGRSFSAWPDAWISRGLAWIREHESQQHFLTQCPGRD